MNSEEKFCISHLVKAATAVMNGERDPRTILYLAANIQRARVFLGELKVAHPEHCSHPEKCDGKGRCMREPFVCIE